MKRFYKLVDVAEVRDEGATGWRVLLDGRGLKTVAGRAQIVPTRATAEALAAEWAGQGAEIDPTAFIYRDMADYALDVVAPDQPQAVRDLLAYAETDTLCYRADPDEALFERQWAIWEPLLAAAEARYDIHFERVSGIIHRPQPEATLARLARVMSAMDNFQLAALRNLASLAASLVLGLEALDPGADIEAIWDAANLEEDWQAELWGKEYEAQAKRARRLGIFTAAARFGAMARG